MAFALHVADAMAAEAERSGHASRANMPRRAAVRASRAAAPPYMVLLVSLLIASAPFATAEGAPNNTSDATDYGYGYDSHGYGYESHGDARRVYDWAPRSLCGSSDGSLSPLHYEDLVSP